MIANAIAESLKPLSITVDEFSELVIRLLDYGVITRDKSQVEAKLYDRFVQCEELVEDYFSIIRVRLQHDIKFCFIRVFPPGSTVPGMIDIDAAFNSGFRVKPSQQDIAAILVLRVEYEKSLREGKVDEKGCVLIPLESLAISHKNLLKRPLPDNHTERLLIFRRLRQLRLIDFNIDDDLNLNDSWISIQPSITSFVGDEVLSVLYPTDVSTVDKEIQDVL
ncbi:MAG: hypothetical protein ACI89U_003183 [Gammaproteobacteria bacterium]|jgi:hypothetical protein